VVDWFITNEDGVRRHMSPLLVALLLLGAKASDGSGPNSELRFQDGVEFCGLRNQATFEIGRCLDGIRSADGHIDEQDMHEVLTRYADELKATVIHLRDYDKAGTELTRVFTIAEPMALEFLNHRPNPLDEIHYFRGYLGAVFENERAGHVGALFVHKSLSETIFFILCWLYYSWFGRQFYSPPLA
jgi:hypothetical protein